MSHAIDCMISCHASARVEVDIRSNGRVGRNIVASSLIYCDWHDAELLESVRQKVSLTHHQPEFIVTRRIVEKLRSTDALHRLARQKRQNARKNVSGPPPFVYLGDIKTEHYSFHYCI
jgi:hypothetical protein